MAAFTLLDEAQLASFLTANRLQKQDEFRVVEGGSVNSNFSVVCGSVRYFLRLYEEQDGVGAAREREMVRTLADAGVVTPTALAHGVLAGRPAALFPWVTGAHICQHGVTAPHVRAVGEALARVHLVHVEIGEGRFGESALRARLETIDAHVFPAARLANTLTTLERDRDRDLPSGLTHGDLFRDNVLWEGARITALLDFESASRGPFVYDLAVTMLAWCYGDALDVTLANAMIDGYESVRPLSPREKRAFYTEARMAALRFTITRITDYAMRGGEGRVMKDWRRFLARLDAIESIELAGLGGDADFFGRRP